MNEYLKRGKEGKRHKDRVPITVADIPNRQNRRGDKNFKILEPIY